MADYNDNEDHFVPDVIQLMPYIFQFWHFLLDVEVLW